LDLETKGLDPWSGAAIKVLTLFEEGWDDAVIYRGDDIARALESLEGRDVIIHNAMFDLPMLERHYPGGTIRKLGRVYDTLTLARIARAGEVDEKKKGAFSLAAVLWRELGVKVSKEQQKSDWSAEVLSPEQIEYAKEDVRHLPALLGKLLELLEDRREVAELEVELTPALADMKVAGVKVDAEGWSEQAQCVQGEIEWVEAQLSDLLLDLYIERGVPEDEADELVEDLNWGSLKQIQECLSDVDVWISSIAGDEIKSLDDPTGILGLIRQRQKLVKLRSSYAEKYTKNRR
jgi:DNA polymerase I-like protein with 3'-5' exonuclease and polymerase domains